MLPHVVLFVGRRQHFALIDEVYLERLKHFRFGKMSNAHFGHHGYGDGLHDLADDLDGGHAGHAPFFTNVRWHTLQGHDGARSGLLRNLGLLGVSHVHDDAALEHLRQADLHPPLVCITVSAAAAIRFLRVHVTSPLGPNVSAYFLPPKFYVLPTSNGCALRSWPLLFGRSLQIFLCLWPAPRRRYSEFLQRGTGCVLLSPSRSLRRRSPHPPLRASGIGPSVPRLPRELRGTGRLCPWPRPRAWR